MVSSIYVTSGCRSRPCSYGEPLEIPSLGRSLRWRTDMGEGYSLQTNVIELRFHRLQEQSHRRSRGVRVSIRTQF